MTDDTIRIVCEGDERLWLEFTRDITKEQRRTYFELLLPAEPPADLPAEERAGWLEVETAQREAALLDVLKQVLVDGQLVFAGKEIRGADKILAADLEGLTITAEAFLAGAFASACVELRRLGNARKPG